MSSPVRIGDLEWDDANIGHIALHKVTPEEVEEVCYGTHLVRKEGHRYLLSGQSAEGRYLQVVLEPRGGGWFRPITAFEMGDEHKRRYRKRLK